MPLLANPNPLEEINLTLLATILLFPNTAAEEEYCPVVSSVPLLRITSLFPLPTNNGLDALLFPSV